MPRRVCAAFAAHPGGGAGGGAVTFQAMLATFQGQSQASDRLAQRALALLPEQSPFFRSCVSLVTGMNHLFAGEDAAAEVALHETIASSDPAGDVMNAVLSRCYLAELNTLRGRLRTAQMLYEQALVQSREEPIGGLALMGLGRLYYDWNDLERAGALLTTGLEKIAAWSDLPVAQGALLLARVKHLMGDGEAAGQLEHRVDVALAGHEELTPVHRSLRLYRMRYALWRGDLPTADLHATVAGLADPLGASPGRGRAVRDAVDGDETPAMEATFVLLSQAHHWLAHGHYDAAAGAAGVLAARHWPAAGYAWPPKPRSSAPASPSPCAMSARPSLRWAVRWPSPRPRTASASSSTRVKRLPNYSPSVCAARFIPSTWRNCSMRSALGRCPQPPWTAIGPCTAASPPPRMG